MTTTNSREIKEQRACIITEARKLIDDNPNGMPAEINAKWEAMMKDVDAMAEQVKTLERQEHQTQLEDELRETQSRQTRNTPTRLSRISTPQDENRAFNAWFVQACSGRISSSGIGRDDYAIMERYFSPGDTLEVRTGLNATTNTAGEYLVPTVWRQSVLEWLKFFAPMRQIAEIWSTQSGDPLKYPIFDATSVTAATTQTAEAASYSEQDPTFNEVSFSAYKNTNYVKITRELIQDNILGDGIMGLVSKGIGSMLARAQSYYFEVGTGSSQQTGLVNAVVSLQSSTPVETDATLSFDAVIDLEYAVDRIYQNQTEFFGTNGTLKQLRKLKDGNSRYLWDALLDPIHNVLVETIHGKKFNVLESMSDFAASGGVTYMVCAVPKLFIIREAGPLTVQVNPFLYMANGQIGIFVDQRTDSNYVGPARSCAYLAC